MFDKHGFLRDKENHMINFLETNKINVSITTKQTNKTQNIITIFLSPCILTKS